MIKLYSEVEVNGKKVKNNSIHMDIALVIADALVNGAYLAQTLGQLKYLKIIDVNGTEVKELEYWKMEDSEDTTNQMFIIDVYFLDDSTDEYTVDTLKLLTDKYVGVAVAQNVGLSKPASEVFYVKWTIKIPYQYS